MGNEERGLGTTFEWRGMVALGVLVEGRFFDLKVVSALLDRFMRTTLEKAGMNRFIDYDYALNFQDRFCGLRRRNPRRTSMSG